MHIYPGVTTRTRLPAKYFDNRLLFQVSSLKLSEHCGRESFNSILHEYIKRFATLALPMCYQCNRAAPVVLSSAELTQALMGDVPCK